jgi:hypothetical protein
MSVVKVDDDTVVRMDAGRRFDTLNPAQPIVAGRIIATIAGQ